MTTELTKAAQQALDALKKKHGHWGPGHDQLNAEAIAALERALTQRPAAQTEREADGLPLIVAGAIFDFAGFMTTRSEVIEVGSTAEAGPVADLVKEWAELRGLDLADAAVLSWQLHITRASLPAPQQATPEPLTGCNCRWQGETQVEWCGLHLAHKEAIHEWAERAKAAEAKLAATPEPVGEQIRRAEAIRLINALVDGDTLPPSSLELLRELTRPAPGVPEVLTQQVMEALRDSLSVCESVQVSRDRKISREGCALYAQTEEWCRWLDAEVGPKIRAALDALAAAQAKGGQ